MTPDSIEAAAVGAASWIERNQREDGRYLYEYDRDADRVLPGYNIVRHAGVTMSLYQLARAGHTEVLDAADAGLDVMLDDLVPAGGGRAFTEPGASQARLGASALMAAALAQRRDATGDDRYDRELRALGRFMEGQISTGGQMLALFDLQADVPVPGETSRYATGEAAWAFAQLHNLFPDEGWDVPARRVVDYLATARDEVEGLVIPPWADQWAAYALGEMASWGLERASRQLRPRAVGTVRDAPALRVPEGWMAAARRRPSSPRRRPGRVGGGARRTGHSRRTRRAPLRAAHPVGDPDGLRRRHPGRAPAGRRRRWPVWPNRSGSRAPGSATASPGWTISSTCCRACWRRQASWVR